MAKHKKEKFLTLILRHQPEVVGITLDRHGWANVAALVKGIQTKYPDFDEAALRFIVDNSEKKRFEYSSTNRSAIRACQGHSVKIDLGLEPTQPPKILYHGTTWKALASITEHGLKPMSRTHVQLSEDVDTANAVGLRHGNDVCILEVKAGEMFDQGIPFIQSTNGVWLVEYVEPLHFVAHEPYNLRLQSPYKEDS